MCWKVQNLEFPVILFLLAKELLTWIAGEIVRQVDVDRA